MGMENFSPKKEENLEVGKPNDILENNKENGFDKVEVVKKINDLIFHYKKENDILSQNFTPIDPANPNNNSSVREKSNSEKSNDLAQKLRNMSRISAYKDVLEMLNTNK